MQSRSRLIRGVLAVAGALWIAGAAHAAEIRWSKSLTPAMAEAKKSGKLVMVDFFTEW